MLKRIKYISRYAETLTNADMENILRVSIESNKKQEITGILMTSGRLFFQIIEGPTAAIDELYRKITHDDRHQNVLLLNTEWNVKNRLFPDWSMRQVCLESSCDTELEPLKAILDTIIEMRSRQEVLVDVLERAIWSHLMTG